MTDPCSLDFLNSVDVPAQGIVDEARLVQDTILKLKESGRSWVKVKDLVEVVYEGGVETSPQRLGKQLSDMRLPSRRNPDAK